MLFQQLPPEPLGGYYASLEENRRLYLRAALLSKVDWGLRTGKLLLCWLVTDALAAGKIGV